MDARRIADNVDWVGAIDWDRQLFDALVPLPDGTSYNAYLVRGKEKVALIDAVDPAHEQTLMARLASAGVTEIDLVVSQHSEQDHSGSIPAVLAEYPEARLLASDKGKRMLLEHLPIAEQQVQTVKDGQIVDLGGLTLQFLYTPWVHWPETMLTWLPERRTLFTCDLFGSHLATGDTFAREEAEVLVAAKRYFAEIMMPFRSQIERYLDRVNELDPAIIAPSHGPVFDRPSLILDAYQDWVSSPPQNMVLIPYVSMHGSTRIMVEHFLEACWSRGMRAQQINLAQVDTGKLAMLMVDAATIVLATPTVLGGPHPQVAYAAFLANLLKPKARHFSVIGSFGWGGKAVEQLSAMIPNLKVELLPQVLCKGLPNAADFAALDALAESIAAKHAAL
ncbi:MAG: FprA family A-type flavoprotein [Polyangiaceae bacterium]|nr:FprA family A-type flavoprotein [Polyangiaceae bacterium]